LLVLARAVAAPAQPTAGDRPVDERLELGVLGGVSSARAIGTTTYRDSWSSFFFTGVDETATIDTRAKGGTVFGGFVSYFATRHLGLQLLAEYARVATPTTAAVSFGWTPAGEAGVQKSKDLAGMGRLARIPVSLNIAARAGWGPLTAELSGGATLFRNTLSESSFFSYGVTRLYTVYVPPNQVVRQSIDALLVPLKISEGAWNALGADVGGGLTLRLGGRIGLMADARYYHCPKKLLHWDPVPGTYDGIFTGNIKGEPFSDQDAAYLAQNNKTFDLDVNPSFFRVAAGIVVFVGRRSGP
jgi:hypothetical protein